MNNIPLCVHIYIYVCVCVLSCFSKIPLFVTLWPVAHQTPWDFPGKNTGVGCHALLQGIFPTQEWNPQLLGPLHCQVGSLPLKPPGKPYTYVFSVVSNICNLMAFSPAGTSVHGILQARILQWVPISYSRESSKLGDWTFISCIGRQDLYQLSHQGRHREALYILYMHMAYTHTYTHTHVCICIHNGMQYIYIDTHTVEHVCTYMCVCVCVCVCV